MIQGDAVRCGPLLFWPLLAIFSHVGFFCQLLHFLPLLANCAPFWSFLTIFGTLWLFQATIGHIRQLFCCFSLLLAAFHFWQLLVTFRLFQAIFGHLWPLSAVFGHCQPPVAAFLAIFGGKCLNVTKSHPNGPNVAAPKAARSRQTQSNTAKKPPGPHRGPPSAPGDGAGPSTSC